MSRACINYDTPKHRCPICFHTCSLIKKYRNLAPGSDPGRPPTARRKLVHLLKMEASKDRPMSMNDIAERLNIRLTSVPQYLHRAKKIEGVDVQKTDGGGYYILPSDSDEE